MKRNYQAMGMVAIAMGLWTSCAQTSVIDSAMETKGEIIGFSTYANKTRGVPTDNNGFKTDGNDFGVTAFISTTGNNAAYMGTATDGAQIKYATTPTAAWNYQTAADARYWPTGTSETLDFYAYAPFTDDNRVATPAMSKASGMTFTDYTVPTTSTTTPPTTDFTKQKDFMYASALGKTKNSTDVSAGKLTLTFNHALTQILFKAKTNQSNLYVDIQKDGIELCNIQSKGTFTLTKTTNTWTSTTPATYDKYIAPTKQVIAENATTVELINTAPTSADALMLMPQTLTAWAVTTATDKTINAANTAQQSYLKIMCKIFTASSKTSGTPDAYNDQVYLHGAKADAQAGTDGYKALYVPFSSKAIPASGAEKEAWEMGNKVTYTLIFGGGYNDKGEPILTPITFDTTVTNWNEANKDINL